MATPADCQMLGDVQDLFPTVLTAVDKFRRTKPDAESRSVARGLNTEAALYRRLIAKILLLADVPSIRDPNLHQNVTAKVGVERTALLLTHLKEMHRLLTTLIWDFGNTSRGTTLLRELQPETSSSKANVPKSKMQRRVDKVSRANVQLTALLELRTSLPFPDTRHSPSSAHSWYHHDGDKPAEALKAIVAALRCSCSKSHIAGLRCACSGCNPGFAEPEPIADAWDFEVALCQPDWQQSTGKGGPGDSPTVPSPERGSTTWTSRVSLEANPLASQSAGLCPFLRGSSDGEQAVRSIPHMECLNKSPKSFSSLYDLMQGRTPLLDTRKRLALAYRLSLAVLQYSHTPWADRSWNPQDWLVGLDRSSKDGLPVVFLNRQISPSQEPIKSNKSGSAWEVASREPILAQLGIALAELALGRSLSVVRKEQPELMDKELGKAYDLNLLDLLTTRKILSLGQIAQAISQPFEDVVSACVTQQYRDGYDAGVKELDTTEPSFLERATAAILQPLYLEGRKYFGFQPSNSSTNASSRAETKRSPSSPVHKHAETRSWKQPAPAPTPTRRAKPPPSDTLRPSRQFSPPPPAASSGSEGVFVDSLTNTTRTDAAVATKTSGTDRDGHGGTPRPTEPSSSQRRSQQSSGLESVDTPPGESTNDDTGSMDFHNGEADEDAPPSCGEDTSTWSFGDYSESDQSLDSAFDWLPGEEQFVRRLHDQHPLLAHTDTALKRIFTEFRIYMAAGGSTMPSRQAPSVAGSYAASTTGPRKRQRPGHGGPRGGRRPDDGDDGEEYPQRPSTARDDPSGEEKGPPFACPYFKKDSMVHQSCYQFTLRRIRDVKQHVGRKHSLPIYCPVCNDIFPKEQERDNHVRENRCPQKPFAKPEGTTEEQKKKLGKRAPANQTREEQWYGIFYTLFDDSVTRPLSPYLQIDGVLFHGALNFQQYILAEGVQVLDTYLAEHNAISWNNIPYDEEDAASFRRHILEQGVRHMFQNYEARSALQPTPSIPESLPAASEPTQSSSDIYPVTPSSMASQAGTNYSTPQNMPPLAMRPLVSSSSMPQPFGFAPHPSSNPDFTPNPDFTSTGHDYGNVAFAEELQDIFGMTALTLENGLIDDMNFDAASYYSSTSAAGAGQSMNFFNFQ